MTVCLIAIAAGLFFKFSKAKKPNNIETPESETRIESVPAQTMPVISEPEANISEPTKILPAAVPILMYHYIRDYTDPRDPIGVGLSVSPQKFETQLAWLRGHNYQTVFPHYFVEPQPLAAKPVVLTFDDGYQDAYDAVFPLLQKYHLAGMFYLIVNKVGTPGYLSWEEILAMQQAGMMFGDHTLSHPDLSKLEAADLAREIQGSQTVLEQKLGRPVTDFCYPSGKYDAAVLKELNADHFQAAVTTQSGIDTLKSNPLLLSRLRITEQSDLSMILK